MATLPENPTAQATPGTPATLGTVEETVDRLITTYYPQGIGERFACFRKFLGLSQKKMAEELNVKPVDLRKLERGQIDEEIYYPLLVVLFNQYGVNANWLTSGHGYVFSRKGPKTPDDLYQFQKRLQNPEKTDLFLDMVISPALSTSILAKLVDLTNFFKDQIKASRVKGELHE
jgi:transcriptional regulator with XRE-family HTH domain